MTTGTAGTPGRERPTLEAVAAAAGVSRATVSRVVNGQQTVNPGLRAVVERAVHELGYVPNSAARTLVTRTTDSVALVVSESHRRLFSDPFFGSIAASAAEELSRGGKQLILMTAAGPDDHARLTRYFESGHVDAALLLSMHDSDPLPDVLARTGITTVAGGRPVAGGADPPYVDTDNLHGARDAVRYLLRAGRRRVATVAGPADMAAGTDRLIGYRDAFGQQRYEPSLVAEGDFTSEGGRRAMTQLLERVPDLDAVFVASDLMAGGALRALADAGRGVPDDVAVVGFDDSEVAELTAPPLTTVRWSTTDMGRCMVQMVLGLLRGEPAGSPKLLPTKLVIRASA